MKFKVSEDIDAPVDVTWSRFTDFSHFESEVRGRGADLVRVGDWSEAGAGAKWRGSVPVRGKSRAISSEITRFEPHETCLVQSQIGGMACAYEMDFVALSPEVTRVSAVMDLSASSLSARLLLQTMKLARGKVLQRMQGVLARQGNAAEAAWRKIQRERQA
ncbi:hypothetical protein roselon_00651 [Roseibacterium elongatum DSM 19469]|uniref:Polyketide cyclase / dehydrase and lipid transport n=1 Tax=Roseicyclus elongatus DSM 19469 TaxID=1294273 RepID=W8RPI9_9RHOB|nr:SRPBCC family protein [Roseibacterium elongatum]AHM03084.1 hypothetical protein roselon_00651 [Roseibacterium elongatum DSM 19469]